MPSPSNVVKKFKLCISSQGTLPLTVFDQIRSLLNFKPVSVKSLLLEN